MDDIKAIIFDCFGVIYPQAAGSFFDSHRELFESNPAALVELNLKIDLGKITRAEFFNGLSNVTGIPSETIQSGIDNQLIPDVNLVELIMSLRQKYKIGLLSNAGHEEISIIYRDKLDYLFDELTVSYKVGLVKPSPEIYMVCVNNLKCNPEECLFIDDSLVNLEAAKSLSLKTLHYPIFGRIPDSLSSLAM